MMPRMYVLWRLQIWLKLHVKSGILLVRNNSIFDVPNGFHTNGSIKFLNDCCLFLSPFNRGGLTISRPSLYFSASQFFLKNGIQNTNPNEVTLLPILCRFCSVDVCI